MFLDVFACTWTNKFVAHWKCHGFSELPDAAERSSPDLPLIAKAMPVGVFDTKNYCCALDRPIFLDQIAKFDNQVNFCCFW